MSSIDKRIVQMQFDNQNFESGVSKTMSSLQKLNEKLQMKNSTSGLDGVNESLNKLSGFGVSGLANGVETVTAKFSALGVIGMTALSNITNSAVNAGKQLIKSLTIDPIKTGFSEYETKMGAIQTILTNTSHQGTTLEDVNKVLAELNEYSDKTIYNFAEMTRNIGTFTAAGIDLDTSATAIKGIANLAAASGSSSQQASTAMYQLSQALAAGRVSLADWNSVVNAGMGGKLFQDALIRTSEIMGTGADSMIKKYGSFRESLTQGQWLTTEVLTETLKQLAGAYTEADLIAQGYTESQAKQIVELAKNASNAATEVKTVSQLMDTMKESVQSGWATSWEHIIGDKDEATKILTSISQGFESLIKPSTDARNKMLEFWNEAGGRDDVIKGFTNIFQSLGKGFKSVGEAWNEVFPSMSGEKLVELSAKFKDFTENFKMSDETANKLKNTFKGVFTVFDTVKDAIVGVVKGFTPLLGIIKPIGSGMLSVTSSIGSFVSKIGEAAERSKIFENIGDGIKSAFEAVGTALSAAGDKVSDFISKMNMGNAFDVIGKAFSKVGDIISKVADGIGKAIGSINFETLSNVAKTLAGVGIFKVLKDLFDKFKGIGDDLSGVFDSFKGIGEGISGVLDSVKESLTAYQNSLNAATLLKLASAIAILAASLVVLSTIDPGRLATALAGMAGLFAELSLAMMAINKIGNIKGLMKTSTSMILMATAILILSSALKKLAGLNLGEIATGIVGLAATLGVMVAAVKLFSKSSSGLGKTSASLIIFGAAMHVMASALKQLGSIDAETMGAGLFALAGVLTELALFLAAAKFGSLSLSSATGILVLSAALVVLSQAMSQFGNMETDNIIRGLAGIAGVLTEIAVFSKLGGSGLNMIALGAGLTVMGAAILVLAQAIKQMGSVSWETIGKGLTSLAGALTILGVASALISGPQMLLLSVGLGAMSIALIGLATALNMMGDQSWEEIGKSMVTLAGALTILGVAMYAMSGGIVGAAAMVVMAGALALLTPQILLLGQMSLAEIGSSLLALAGVFTVLGLAGLVLTPLSPVIALLGAAIALLGAGCLAAGAGISMFATGFALIGATIAASGAVILDFVNQLILQLPQLGIKAAEGFANFMLAISTAIPQITAGMVAIGTAILTALTTLIPQMVDTGVQIVVAFAQGLASAVPQLVTSGLEMITGVLEGIAQNIGPIVEAGADICINFMNGVAEKLPEIIDSGINLALSFVEGVAEGISNNSPRLEAAIEAVIQAMIDAGLAILQGGIDGFVSGGEDLTQGLIDGIESLVTGVASAAESLIDSAVDAVGDCGTALFSAGKSLVEGFCDGIESALSWVGKKASEIATAAKNAAEKALGINSPSRVFIQIGKFVDQGFVNGLEQYSSRVSKAATGVADKVVDNFSRPLGSINNLIDSDVNMQPVITPVLDLSNVRSNARRLNSMMPNNSTMTLSTDAANIMTSSMGKVQNGVSNGEIVSAIKDLKDNMTTGGNTNYNINGITYDDGSNIVNAVETLVRAARIERRI